MSSALANPVTPQESEEQLAQELYEVLLDPNSGLLGPHNEPVQIPDSVRRAFLMVLVQMQKGNGVAVIPVGRELTTKEAADMLGVSRQYFVRLLDRGDLPFHMIGTHRRISLTDLLRYRARRDQERHSAINRIARQGVEEGIYNTFLPPDED
jgi:excisionase family DNA binding protein